MSSQNDDDPIVLTQLLLKAGPRAQPPEGVRNAVYAATVAAWQQGLQQRRRKQMQYFALAASITMVALGLVWFMGSAEKMDTRVAARPVGNGAEIRVGEAVHVDSARGLVLQTLAGERLRVAAGSDFKFIGTERIQLLSGQVYVESSDSDTGNQRLEIRTQFGSVTHLGTRYAVALSTDRMAIRVREGLVGVTTGALRTDAGAGVEVEIDRKGREINRQRISTYGSMWAWAESLAPPLQIDGRRLADVLREIAAETGRRLEFANEAVRRACAEIELKGPFLDLPAADRLFAVLVTTGLEATESGDRILIQEQMEDTSARPVSD